VAWFLFDISKEKGRFPALRGGDSSHATDAQRVLVGGGSRALQLPFECAYAQHGLSAAFSHPNIGRVGRARN
jgi:hypothetical protein